MTVLLLAGGVVAGLLAGLLGIGGGLVLVPLLTAVLVHQGLEMAAAVPVAVGTSLATIVFTGASAALAHHRRGALPGGWAPLALAGACGAALGAASVPLLGGDVLKGLFAAFEAAVGLRFLLAARARERARPLPGLARLLPPALFTGWLSALLGIGGGTLSVPWFAWLGLSLHRAVALSSALGVGIASAGAAAFAVLPPAAAPGGSLGHLWLPAVAAVVPTSVLAAQAGARLAHRLPVAALRRLFGGVLLVTAAAMAWA